MVWLWKGNLEINLLGAGYSFLPSTSEGKEKTLTLINVYCPHADPGKPERLSFKMRFYRLLQIRAEALLAAGRYYINLGSQAWLNSPW